MNASLRLCLTSLLLSATACQCGGSPTQLDGGNPPDNLNDPPVALAIEPLNAVYETDGVTAATATYKATATYADGRTEDVSSRASFSIGTSELGSFTGAVYKSVTDRGGSTLVTASLGTLIHSTNLTLNLKRVAVDPGSMNVPADASTKFGGTVNATRAPQLVYPNDGVLLPPNLGKLEFHFLTGASNTLFQLAFKSKYSNVTVHLRCATPLNGGCIYQPDPSVWRALAASNRGGDPVTATLKGTDDTGAEYGESAVLSFSFSNDDIQGGLYYWTTTAKAIMRFDFASATQTVAEKFADAANGGRPGVDCIGCHALSRDGRKMIVEAQGSDDGRFAILNVATKQPIVAFPESNAVAPTRSFFSSWNPDASQFVGVDDRTFGTPDYNLKIMDGNTGALVLSVANTGTDERAANHPDWSADGKTIAFARVQRTTNNKFNVRSLQWPANGGIAIVTRDAAGAWSGPVDIVLPSNGKNRVYPAIAPSNDYLVFGESTCASGNAGADCDADTDPNMRLFAAKLAANAAPVELAKANKPGIRDNGQQDLTNSFPKWSPFNFQRTAEVGSKLQWLTFSSSRAYGLRPPTDKVWLWMVAVDPDKLNAGQDPSYTAFCLPFQDLSTSNHIAQWTQVVVPVIN